MRRKNKKDKLSNRFKEDKNPVKKVEINSFKDCKSLSGIYPIKKAEGHKIFIEKELSLIEQRIIKAIAETFPYSFDFCKDIYIGCNSLDETISIIERAFKDY